MTRILVPDAFGLIAMVAAIITAFSLFSDIGIHRSVVRERDGADAHFLHVAWVAKITRGGVISGGICATALSVGILAPHFATEGTVYADPRLPWLIAISALAPIMQGFESTKRELALRRLDMGRLSLIEIGAQVTSISAMIAFSVLNPTVWALLAGILINFLAKSISSHLFLSGPSMRFEWDWDIAGRMWTYGKWLLGSSIFTFFARNADRFILGGLLPSNIFGIYVIARIWIDAGQQIIQRIGDQVGFSTLGELVRERPEEAPRLFRKFQNTMDLICLCSCIFLIFLGQTLIDSLYTESYSEAGTYMKIMAISLLVLRFDPLGTLVMSMGNSRAIMIVSAMRAVALAVFMPLSYFAFGLSGALYAVALTPLVSLPYILILVKPILGGQVLYDVLWAAGILFFSLIQLSLGVI